MGLGFRALFMGLGFGVLFMGLGFRVNPKPPNAKLLHPWKGRRIKLWVHERVI